MKTNKLLLLFTTFVVIFSFGSQLRSFSKDFHYAVTTLDSGGTSLEHHSGRRLQNGQILYFYFVSFLIFFNGIIQFFGSLSCNIAGFGTCLCSENSLQSFLLDSDQEYTTICSRTTIRMTQPLDLTGRSFTIGCNPAFRIFGSPNYRSCKLRAGNNFNERMFVGAPVSATFERLDFLGDSRASFFELTGGKAEFSETHFLKGSVDSTERGGAMIISGNDANVLFGFDTLFAENAGAGYGGALAILDGASVEFRGTAFRDNVALQYGGAIYAEAAGSVKILWSNFWRNGAGSNGGAIAVSRSNVLAGESTFFFEGNNAGNLGDNIFADNLNATFVACSDVDTVPTTFCGSLGINAPKERSNCEEISEVRSAANDRCNPNAFF